MEPENGAFFLQWNNFKENTSSTFQEMRKDRDFVDMTLACDDNQKFDAHKLVLAASSSFFSDFLKQNNHPKPFMYLRGIKSRVLISIMDFMYHGEVKIPQEELDEFMKVGVELKVKGLSKEVVQEHLENSIITNPKKINNRGKTKEEKICIIKEEGSKNYKLTSAKDENLVCVDTVEAKNNIELENVRENKHLQRKLIFDNLDSIIFPKMFKLNRKLVCKDCDFKTKDKTKLSYHIESNHLNTKETKIPCLYCDNSTHTRSGLSNHLRKHHTRV